MGGKGGLKDLGEVWVLKIHVLHNIGNIRMDKERVSLDKDVDEEECCGHPEDCADFLSGRCKPDVVVDEQLGLIFRNGQPFMVTKDA